MSKKLPAKASTTSNVIDLAAVRQSRLPQAAASKPPHYADDLSFMRRKKPRGGGIDCWSVKPTGRFGDDCATGKELAREYLRYIGFHPTVGNTTLLTCIVGDMIEKAAGGQGWSGVHVGFLAEVNRAAMWSSYIQLQDFGGRPA